ncbi:HAD domain-containing protein [Paraburkholderia sp. BR14374]|uniref:HAD domain-containing protein n=1 Tax=Paraburkholderia sp. BR14374 TaxID=3237007 RepID=UPI0034CF41B5
MHHHSNNISDKPSPLIIDLKTLGQSVERTRLACQLTLVDAASYIGVSRGVLARIEAGQSVGTERLFKVLTELGLAVLVMPKSDAGDALQAVGHTVNWFEIASRRSAAKKPEAKTARVLDNPTPTLFVDFDGTLHAGHSYIDKDEQISLDSGRPLFEFAPILADMLVPYPAVEIVLTTSWLQRFRVEQVIAFLPPALARRVVGTTSDIKPRFSYLRNGSGRTDVIAQYAFGNRLKNWLALDDSVFDAHLFSREGGEPVANFLLLDSALGISDDRALACLRT